jgi:hypothetical protein
MAASGVTPAPPVGDTDKWADGRAMHLDPKENGDAQRQSDREGPRALTIALAVATAILAVLSIVLVVQYGVPTVRTERTSVAPFEWNGTTQYYPPVNDTGFIFDPGTFCDPSNAIGNLTISLVWYSSVANTTGTAYWESTLPNLTTVYHFLYWTNHTSDGGYSFPPVDSSFFCIEGEPVRLAWFTPASGAVITLSGIREYSYSALEPAW